MMNLTRIVSVRTLAFPEIESEDSADRVEVHLSTFFLLHSFKAAFYRSSDDINLIHSEHQNQVFY